MVILLLNCSSLLPTTSSIEQLDVYLNERQEAIRRLLVRAQEKAKHYADKGRKERAWLVTIFI